MNVETCVVTNVVWEIEICVVVTVDPGMELAFQVSDILRPWLLGDVLLNFAYLERSKLGSE